MDYNTGRGLVFINQRNDSKVGFSIPPEKASQWISQYGSITFNIYGKDMPNSGMNEKGLVVESLWLDETEYPAPDSRDPIPELAWIQYMLDNCTSVDEVIQANNQIRIASTSFAKIHFMILDANGNSAIIEYINGEMMVYRDSDMPYEVLENQTYPQSLAFMRTYPQGDKSYINPIDDKWERFEMMAQMLDDGQEESNAMDYCFEMLQKVSWTWENGDAPTQWAVVYDPKNLLMSFTAKDDENRKTIRFNEFDFACHQDVLITSLQSGYSELKPSLFDRYSIDEAGTHLRMVYEEVPFTRGRIPDQLLHGLINATQKRDCINE